MGYFGWCAPYYARFWTNVLSMMFRGSKAMTSCKRLVALLGLEPGRPASASSRGAGSPGQKLVLACLAQSVRLGCS